MSEEQPKRITYKQAFEDGCGHATAVIKKHVAKWIQFQRSEAITVPEEELLKQLEQFLCLKEEVPEAVEESRIILAK